MKNLSVKERVAGIAAALLILIAIGGVIDMPGARLPWIVVILTEATLLFQLSVTGMWRQAAKAAIAGLRAKASR